MKRIFVGFAASAALFVSLPAAAVELPVCGELTAELDKVFSTEADAHRLFERPSVTLRADSNPDFVRGTVSMPMHVDEHGRPVCVVGTDDREFFQLEAPVHADPGWRYRPFERESRAVAVIVYQPIDAQWGPMPSASPPAEHADTRMTLVRAGCFFECPEYAVSVRADGRVGYHGGNHAALEGPRAWRVPPALVAPLLTLARDPQLWGAQAAYHHGMTDNETIVVRVDIGGERKQIRLYPHDNAGAPLAVRRLAEAIDALPGLRQWVRVSNETIDTLQRAGFDFRSPMAGKLFQRSIATRRQTDEAALLRLIELGVPLPENEPQRPLEIALYRRLDTLVDPLIDRGTLLTDGRPDQAKIDAAFRAAIRGGHLAAAQRIWGIAGDRPHPRLDFDDHAIGDESVQATYPVALLLPEKPGNVEAARWLASLGNDLSAAGPTGKTLVQTADRADDPALMRFLLDLGADPWTLRPDDALAFSVKYGEDMAVAMLHAQLKHRPRGFQLPENYRTVAEGQSWPRVLAWLDAHPSVTLRESPCRRRRTACCEGSADC